VRGSPGPGGAAAPTMAELRAFVTVAEEGRFRSAARRLGVAPSPLSQTVRRLEDKVGAELLERGGGRVGLTPAGARLLPRALDILERIREARVAVENASARASGPFTVGVASNGFAELTGPILRTFADANPRLALRVVDVTPDPATFVLDRSVDVALVRPPVIEDTETRLVCRDVVHEVRAAILSRRHRLAEAESLSIHDLADDPVVAVAPTKEWICDFWAAVPERGGRPARFGVEAWSVPDVLAGVGYLDHVITSFPSLLRFFRVPGLVAVPLTDVSPAPMSVLVLSDDRRPVVAEFGETVRTVCAQLVDLVPGAVLAPGVAAGAVF
jgi:DNA-binding transcriptional LysR family regulator